MKAPLRFAVQTRYRPEFVPALVAFVSETARSLGASPKETSDLALASEEAALHIIERFPGAGLESLFEIQAEFAAGVLRIVFGNQGLPVDPDHLPRYATDRPEETLDGLGLFLLEKLVDRVDFVNLGRQGWRTVLEKRLHQPRLPGEASPEDALHPAPGSEKLRVQRAEDPHVPGIVELAYHTYGYSYAKDLFYYADRLRAALANGSVRSFVALTPSGKVVGQMAILFSRPGSGIGEVGALMVHPDHRRSMGLLQLVKTVIQDARRCPGELAMAESNLVTTHILSQRVCSSANFKPMALKLSVHERARFVQLAEEADPQRESLLHAVVGTRPLPPVPLFIPPPHADFTRRLFGAAGLDCIPPPDAPPMPPQTDLDTELRPDAAYGIVSVHQPGEDCTAALRHTLFDLEADGIRTVAVRLPGWLPRPESFDRDAQTLRLFFSGWVVDTPGHWWLLYSRLNAQRFDFARIQLFDPAAADLRNYVESQFKEAVL